MERVAVTAAARDTIEDLRRPPGRSPRPVDLERSQWFNALGDYDQQMVAGVAARAAFGAAFGLFAVLDGVRAFDEAHGSLRLVYVDPGGNEFVLNDPSGCELHAELRGDGPPP